MNAERFEQITSRFAQLRIAVVGDFCLDRYLEIDPAKQVTPETGVVTATLLKIIQSTITEHPDLVIVADSRRTLRGYPPVCLKMNRSEFGGLTNNPPNLSPERVCELAGPLAKEHGRPIFVTLAEHGLLVATPDGQVELLPAHPSRGPLDTVGAGDAVMASLAAFMSAGATPGEAIRIANAAASVVVQQLGTTGSATVHQMRSRLFSPAAQAQ